MAELTGWKEGGGEDEGLHSTWTFGGREPAYFTGRILHMWMSLYQPTRTQKTGQIYRALWTSFTSSCTCQSWVHSDRDEKTAEILRVSVIKRLWAPALTLLNHKLSTEHMRRVARLVFHPMTRYVPANEAERKYCAYCRLITSVWRAAALTLMIMLLPPHWSHRDRNEDEWTVRDAEEDCDCVDHGDNVVEEEET